MNGGDTTITRSQNSWTRIAGLGIPKGGNFQVFAPNQNENVYTKDWTGPFYGFEREGNWNTDHRDYPESCLVVSTIVLVLILDGSRDDN